VTRTAMIGLHQYEANAIGSKSEPQAAGQVDVRFPMSKSTVLSGLKI
jgi:hypothetical protein